MHPFKVPPFSGRSCSVYADWWCPQDNRVEFYVGEIGMGAISQSNTRTLYGLEESNKCSVRELSIEIKTRSLFLTASLEFRFGNSHRYPASKRLRRPMLQTSALVPKIRDKFNKRLPGGSEPRFSRPCEGYAYRHSKKLLSKFLTAILKSCHDPFHADFQAST